MQRKPNPIIMKKIIPTLLMSLFLLSCGNDRKEISTTFVFDKPINNSTKYPQYFEEITTPFTSECSGSSTDILMKPINVCRLDVSNKEVETNAWHFKDMGDNTVEFSTLWLKQYYKDSLITPYITQPSIKDASIENWLENNKDSVYIFAEDSNIKIFKGKQVFSNTKELNAKIKEFSCGNYLDRVIVLVNPNGLKNDEKGKITKRIIDKKVAKKSNSVITAKVDYKDKSDKIAIPPKEEWSGKDSRPKTSGIITKKDLEQ